MRFLVFFLLLEIRLKNISIVLRTRTITFAIVGAITAFVFFLRVEKYDYCSRMKVKILLYGCVAMIWAHAE